jgi:hypothetical protein
MKKSINVWSGLKPATLTLALLQGGSTLTWPVKAEGKEKEKQVETQTGFYCNIKALTPEERAHHHVNTEKLSAKRKQIVEIEKGYEFQYNPSDVSVVEVADWVTLESKCCPFFDFHIDLENEGKLVCLRLTGREGIKAFIRAEFKLQ